MTRFIRGAVAVAVLLIAQHPATAQTCSVTLTDVTDYATWQSGEEHNGFNHFYTFQAVGTGNIDQVYLYAPSVQGRFNLYCGTKDFCQMFAFCVTPGSYQMNAYAYCADGTEATPQHLPLIVSDERPDHWITGVTPLGGTQYRVDAVFRVPVGQNTVGPEWDVFKRLPDGTFSTEYGRFFNPTVTAAPGDRVDVFFGTCGGDNLPGAPYFKVVTTYIPAAPSVEVAVLDGNGQGAVVGEPAEKPLRVKFTASDPSFNLASLTALFEVITVPAGATGQGVGANETSVAQTYSVPVAADGTASAKFVAGNTAGAYVVRVKSPMSLTGSQALFTTTAQKPDSVAILKDSTDIADKAPTYAVAADKPSTFFAVGLDKGGQKIGPVKCAWSLASSGSGATRGDGTVAPSAAVASTSFTPSHVGQMALSAKSSIKGVSTGKADLYVTSLYVSVDNTFSIASPVDQSAQFVPGSYLDGSYVALSLMQQTGQFISLHVVTGPGAKGTVTFSVDPSHFPGIAMNTPITGADTSADMQFTNNQTSISVPFASNGDTWTTLLVKDYGANGTVTVKVAAGKSTYTLTPRRLPVDNGIGLAAAGWFANGTHIDSTGLAAIDDADDQSSTTFSGQAGDGLSAFEEMRGLVQAGTYTRLDPRQRDLFLVLDQNILLIPDNPISRLGGLGPRLHFLNLNEVIGEDYAPRGLTQTKPVMNPNRTGVPGARTNGQRAVRVIDQARFYPMVMRTTYRGDVVIVPMNRAGIFGLSILDAQDPSLPADGFTAQSPDATRSVEIFEQTYVSAGIHTSFTNGPFGYVDASGNPTEPCLQNGGPLNCDNFDLPHHLILPFQLGPGLWTDLHTIPTAFDDYYSLPGQRCDFPGVIFDGGFTPDMMKAQRGATVAHEIGHAVHLDHTNACGTMMCDRISDTAPLPTNFNQQEQNGVRLWQ